jgi:tetratricopeptide (TPR) repeat protein
MMNSLKGAIVLACAPVFLIAESSLTIIPAVDEPPELTGPPKKITPPAPVFKEFAAVWEGENWKESDSAKMKALSDRLTTFLERHPDFGFAYMMRTMSNFCFAGSTDYQSISSDLVNALRYRTDQYGDAYDEPTLLAMRGKIHFQVGEYKQALDDLEAAMRSNLDNADKIFGSGDTKPETDNRNPCIWTTRSLDVLEKQFPKDYRVPLLRGIYIKFFTTFDEKFYPQATDQLQKAAFLNPRSPLPPFFLGEVQMKSAFWTKAAWSSDEGKTQPWRRAMMHYTKAIQLDPKFTLAYTMRASAYSGLKEYPQAIADYDKVLELDKENIIAYADRGLANLEIGRYLAATVDLGEAIRRKGEDGNTLSLSASYEYRGDAYAKMGSYRDAIESYSQAIKYQLANMTYLISLKQFRGLYPEYDKIPDEALVRKINVLFWPQYDLATMTQVLTEKKSEWKISMINDVYEKRADCYLKNGDYRRGVLDFNRIYKGIPDFGQYVERWRSMGGKTGEEWFIDVQSTEFGSTPRLWAKFMEKDKGYTVQSFDFDCKSRRIATTSIAKYNKGEQLVGSSETGSGWQRVIPQTRGEQMYFGMCGK